MAYPSKHVRIAGILLIGCGIGLTRTHFVPSYVNNPFDEYIEFEALVVREPELRVSTQRFVVESTTVNGLVQVSAPLQPRIQIGDVLSLRCNVRKPEPFDGFRYDRYLERFHIGALCSYPGIHVLDREETWRTRLFDFKQQLAHGLRHALAPPEQTILLGALFGDKRAVSPHIMDAFRTTGTSHLLVISGLHVSLLTIMIMHLLKALRIPRKGQVLTVVTLLVLYVVLTGVQPSATRATIFGGAILAAEILGRRSQSLRILLLAGTGMLLLNPLLLLYDAGFQLSFAATAGIIVFGQWFQDRATFIPSQLGLRRSISTSLAAIIATAPLIAYSFNNFSPVALLANTVLVPLMPLVMVGGIVVTALAKISQGIASWVAIPLYYLIHLMIEVVRWFAALPFASIEIPDFHVLILLVLCVHLVLLGWYLVLKKEDA